jgi:ribosomal protein S18 acetylase RimI-like enzyme
VEIVLAAVHPGSAEGRTALTRYAQELAERAPVPPAPSWIEDFLAADPRSLAPPRGLFVVATLGEDVVGCAGLRLTGDDVPPGAGEIKRMWVDPTVRGRRLGTRLLDHLVDIAREAGLRRIVLDTRGDLTEARALYAREGFVEIAPYNQNPDAEHWYARELW